jgi:ABC-type enterochelin transport system permease subunit
MRRSRPRDEKEAAHMKFISPTVHGALDYAVAGVLIAAPLFLGFSDVSVAAAVIAVGAGIALFVYSLLTDYSAGVRP